MYRDWHDRYYDITAPTIVFVPMEDYAEVWRPSPVTGYRDPQTSGDYQCVLCGFYYNTVSYHFNSVGPMCPGCFTSRSSVNV